MVVVVVAVAVGVVVLVLVVVVVVIFAVGFLLVSKKTNKGPRGESNPGPPFHFLGGGGEGGGGIMRIILALRPQTPLSHLEKKTCYRKRNSS